MNNSEVIERLKQAIDRPEEEVETVFRTFVLHMRQSLGNQKKFTIPGLGTFGTRLRSHRRSFNPHHNKMMELPVKQVAKFRQAKRLKENVQEVNMS